tara:strand:- start:152 stop:493 length:342 start_codon:yes stop_codon:yes gene_type:complete
MSGNVGSGTNPVSEIFVDGVGGIVFTKGTVRLELVCASPFDSPTPEKGEPPMVPRQRLVLPLEGFLRSFGVMQNLVNKLAQEGIVKRTDRGASELSSVVTPTSAIPGESSNEQ